MALYHNPVRGYDPSAREEGFARTPAAATDGKASQSARQATCEVFYDRWVAVKVSTATCSPYSAVASLYSTRDLSEQGIISDVNIDSTKGVYPNKRSSGHRLGIDDVRSSN